LPQEDEGLQLRGRGAPREVTQQLINFEKEDVARFRQMTLRVKSPAKFDKDPPHMTEEPRAFETEILAVPHPCPRMTEHPAE
jgi:hypothetical protein